MTKSKILVADDEQDVVDTVRFRLEREGFEVVTAENGLEALGAARVHLPDLLILDVMMPGENGYRVSRMIREDQEVGAYPADAKILLLTARDLRQEPEREQTMMEFSGADQALYKPFELDELIETVKGLLTGDGS
jgi:CheY-like chemotaxis protein